MNFSTFANHFGGGVATVHQQFAKFPLQEAGSPVTGVGTQTSLGEEPTRCSGNGNISEMGKFSRDTSTQVGGILCPSPVEKYPEQHISPTTHYSTHYHIHEEKRYESSLSHQEKDEKKDFSGGQPQQSQQQPLQQQQQQQQPSMPPTWQSIAAPGSTVADYLSHLPASTLPISLHHFLKYSAETIKKDEEGVIHVVSNGVVPTPAPPPPPPPVSSADSKRRGKKKKPAKEKKPRPRPGEIRLTTALDGSTLYGCPECHMAYPDKGLLEQHLLGHTLERRFFCDVCGAGLKRKDHLTRHRQSHNAERPFACSVCLKAFKRKEQLTLHFVIHSGEKRHICTECGKGFYRKDHLRKHTRSHIARRVKAELSQHVPHVTAHDNAS